MIVARVALALVITMASLATLIQGRLAGLLSEEEFTLAKAQLLQCASTSDPDPGTPSECSAPLAISTAQVCRSAPSRAF